MLYVICPYLSLDMPANGTFFMTYEALQDWLKKNYQQGSDFAVSVFAGGVAGMSYWILGMPADVAKSRLQTAPEGTYKHGVREVFAEILKKDGVTALYRGVQPVMIRAFPANAACFLELS